MTEPDHETADREPDRGTADRGTADRGTADRGTADRGTADRGTADRGPDGATTRPGADRTAALRETYRQQMISSIGGWSGALITAIPTVVFVIVNVLASLRTAVVAAVASALVLAGYRMVRKQSVQQALSGLIGVVVGALIAARTGEARGYFLVGIWTSFAYAVPFLVSVLIRRPLVGVIWEFLDPTPLDGGPDAPDRPDVPHGAATKEAAGTADEAPRPWRRVRPLLTAYTWATLAATAVFLARGVVQLTLYGEKHTGWLAFARIAMGYPLFIAAVGFAFLVVTRARRRVATHAAD